MLNSPSSFDVNEKQVELVAMSQADVDAQSQHECQILDFKPSACAVLVESVSVPNFVCERTTRTQHFSLRFHTSFAKYICGKLKNLFIFVKHNSWRLFPSSAPFLCKTPTIFYVYALREILC